MADAGSLPIARVLHLRGGDLADPSTAEAIRDEVVPRIWAHAGFLSTLIMVDRNVPAVRSVTFWDGEQAARAVETDAQHVIGALAALTSAQVTGPDEYRVLLRVVDRADGRLHNGADGAVVSIDRLAGGDLTNPDVLATVTARVHSRLADDPDCLGVVLLAAVRGSGVLCLSFHEPALPGRLAAADLFADLAEPTGARAFHEGPYEVLVHEHPE